MDKFASAQNARCVHYAISVARAALGMSPLLPVEPERDGVYQEEITELLGDWFPNHMVHVFSNEDMSKHIKSDNVIYEGNEIAHDEYPSEDHLFMFMYRTCPDYAHFVIGTIINHDGELVFAAAVEREALQIQDAC